MSRQLAASYALHQGEQARPGEQATPQELAKPEPPELFLMPLSNMEQFCAAEAQLKNFTNRTLPEEQLVSLGDSKNLQKVVREMVGRLFSKQVQEQFSLLGYRGKSRFKDAMMCKVVIEYSGLHTGGYIFLLREADRLIESSWPKVIQFINPARAAICRAVYSPPTILSDTELSTSTMNLLAKGHKCALDGHFSRVDQLAAAHQVAARIPEQYRQQFLGAAVQAVCSRPAPRPSGSAVTRSAVKELREKNLTLLQADKTGEFVVLERGTFQEKVSTALN
ncbi:hypothetical protein HPB47_007771 [Ixodes persulcatus]|uniref:Uncharacterized protein n=1 Tax=Ixodes persulcatus TaxID=34615 RepID=A0AC60P6V9_IXOPE|nr:hypothetical protein HPB47_007771 [Ixodes persulcatus]